MAFDFSNQVVMLAQGHGKIISIAACPGLEGRANQAEYAA